MSAPHPDDLVLYDSERTSLASKVLTAVCAGAAIVVFMSFARWFTRTADFGVVSLPMVAVGVLVATTMSIAALRSRVVRRVEVTPDAQTLLLYRDPGTIERLPFATIVSVTSEAVRGGWSRDPAELLVLTLQGGHTVRHALPDDADTPGIVTDLRALLKTP